MASKTTTDPIEILLEMGVDLDNLSSEEDYLSALLEAVATIEFKTKGSGDERTPILRKEVIEVRKKRKAADSKFKVKKTTIGKENYSKFYNNLLNTKRSTGNVGKTQDTQYTPNLGLPALPASKGSAIVKRDSVNIEKFKSEPVSEGTQQNFDDILNGIDSILETLREDNKLKKKESNQGRRKDEERKRKKQEDKLEKNPFKKLGGVVGTILKPIKSMWERIWDFIWNVFLGRTLMKLVDWFSDPENKGKLEAIGKFLEKTWPILLAGYLLFGNSIGRLITSIVANTLKWTVKLGAIVAKQLMPLAKKLGLKKGLMLGGLAVGGAMLAGRMMDGGKDDVGPTKDEASSAPAQTQSPTKRMVAGEEYDPNNPTEMQQKALDLKEQINSSSPKPLTGGKTPYERATEAGYEVLNAADGLIIYEKDGKSKQVTGTFRVQGATTEERFNNYFSTPRDKFLRREDHPRFDPTTAEVPKLHLKGGGQVPGSGPNKDTVPAMLAPGEFVMSRGAVQKYGSSTLASMNAAGGGTNLPERVNGITYAAGGGMIGNNKEMVEKKEELSSQDKKEMEERKSGITDQLSSTVKKRHAELMKSTNQKKIADYDNKHGAGAYSKKLLEKLNKMYSPEKMTTGKAKPTGKVVGRENLSPEARAAIARLEDKKGMSPDIKTTGPLLGRLAMGMGDGSWGLPPGLKGIPGLGGGGGGTNALTEQAKSKTIAQWFGDGIQEFFGITPKRLRKDSQSILGDVESRARNMATSMGGTVIDGNIGNPTAQEQRDLDALAAGKAELKNLLGMNNNPKEVQDDPLFAEYQEAFDNPKHPLHDQVAGDLFADDKPGMRFADFKKLKAEQSQAKLSPNQPSPPPPPKPPSQSQSSVSQISATQGRRNARRSTSSKKYSGEANRIGPKHPVPRDSSKSKTLGVLV